MKNGFMKVYLHTGQLLADAGISGQLPILVMSYLISIEQYSEKPFYRLKDIASVCNSTINGVHSAVKKLETAGLISTKATSYGNAKRTEFEIHFQLSCKTKSNSVVKQNTTQLENVLQLSCKTDIDTSIDSIIDSNTDMSVLQANPTATQSNKIEVVTSNSENQVDSNSELVVVTQKKEKKKVAPKKKDHPETDRLLDKLMLVFAAWPLPRQPKRDRETMRKLLAGQRPTPPETLNRLIDYLHWRGYDKDLKQDLDGRHPCEIRAVTSFAAKMDKLHAEMEHARILHSGGSQRQVQNNAKRQQDIQRYLQDRDYLDSPEGKAAVAALEREFDGL